MLKIVKDKISKRKREIKTDDEEVLQRIKWKLTHKAIN